MNNDAQLITKSNHLIQQTLTSMNVKEMKLVAVLLADFHKAFRGDVMCTQTVFSRSEFLNLLGINDSGMNFDRLDVILKHFQQRAICQWIDNKNSDHITPFFKDIRFHRNERDGDNDIVFTWNDYIIPLVVGLDKNFTKLLKRNILALNSRKAIIFYELLKSYMSREFPFTMKIPDIKQRLEFEGECYNEVKYLLRKVDEITGEINKSTDIIVTYVKNKNPRDRRKTESLTFKIEDQSERKAWWSEYPEILLSEEQYEQVKTWNEPVSYKQVLSALHDALANGKRVRVHFKWMCTYRGKLLKKLKKEGKFIQKPESQTKEEANVNTIESIEHPRFPVLPDPNRSSEKDLRKYLNAMRKQLVKQP